MEVYMEYTNFSMLDQLDIPSYERKFDDINMYDIFTSEEIERYSLKKITLLAIMSDLDPSVFDFPDHLHIVMVSIANVKFNKDLYNIFKKVTAYCGSICLVVFEKNGTIKMGACDDIEFKKHNIQFGQIVFTQWLYEDYITAPVYAFFVELRQIMNSNLPVGVIYYNLFELFQALPPVFLSEEQVKSKLYNNFRKLYKSPLFQDYVLSTSFSTLRQTEGYEPLLRYEKSSVLRACEQFAA